MVYLYTHNIVGKILHEYLDDYAGLCYGFRYKHIIIIKLEHCCVFLLDKHVFMMYCKYLNE